jgi:hypothetical protein
MSKILRRPMFRGGQVESKDDLKVIDQMGIAKLAQGGRVNYDAGGEVKDYMEILEAVRKSRPELPERKKMSTSDYLRIASAGADILAAPSEGSGIFGALRSSAPALSKLGGDLATSMDAKTTARNELLANEESAITDISGAIMKSRNYRPDRGFNVDRTMSIIEDNLKIRQEIDAALENDASLVKYIQDKELNLTTAEEIAALKLQLKNQREIAKAKLKDVLPKNENMTAFLKTSQARLVFASTIQKEENRQGKTIDDPTFDMSALIESINRIGQKDGGLTTGYAEGGLTEMMAEETINTPEGSETMEEEVVEETPGPEASAPLTYDELRLRLPPEVSDSVVKLLAASDEALLEFSNIATQQDVDEFNVKYGVELVLPQV